MKRMEAQMQQQGIPVDYYYQIIGQTREQVAESRRPEALQQLRIQMTLEAIIKAEGIEANEEEIDAELVKQAEAANMEADKLRETLNDSQREFLKDQANIQKAVKLMMEEAVVTDRPAETEKAPEEENAGGKGEESAE